ncbi:MAG TPA: ion transporter [Saprospiraceae bacterium]|nr:ion transporter [Saprospiraceae bacterium]
MIKRLFINDTFILSVIVLNFILIFIGGLDLPNKVIKFIDVLDVLVVCIFCLEVYTKLSTYGTKHYFSSSWNKFDFIITLLSLPTLLVFVFDSDANYIGFLSILRILRIFRSFRLFKFIPGVEQLFAGIKTALKTSLLIFIGFTIYVFVIAVLSYYLFSEISPTHYGNTGISLYSTFKTFTVEGWFEIPEILVEGQSDLFKVLTYFYFVFVVVTGGMFGLSLVNSIFVDAMVMDNNDELLQKVENLERKIDELLKK